MCNPVRGCRLGYWGLTSSVVPSSKGRLAGTACPGAVPDRSVGVYGLCGHDNAPGEGSGVKLGGWVARDEDVFPSEAGELFRIF